MVKYGQIGIILLSLLGLALSIYAYHVETMKEANPDYVAKCDLSEQVSCSKVFASRYGRGFGLLEFIIGKDHILNQPNSVFGVVLYCLMMLLVLSKHQLAANIMVFFTAMANAGSVYLACILIFVLHDLCIVCVSTYVINFLLLLLSLHHRRTAERILKPRKKYR